MSKVPESCCVLTGDPLQLTPEDPSCIIQPTLGNSFLETGCYSKVSTIVARNVDMVIGVVVVIAATQMLAIVLSFCLCRAVGKDQDYHYKY